MNPKSAVVLIAVTGTFLLGFTWQDRSGDVDVRGYAGFTTVNYLTNVKGAGPTDIDASSDMKMGSGLVLGGALQRFATEWLSLRLDAAYQPKGCGNCIKSQGIVVSNLTAPASTTVIKGWKGDAIVLGASTVLHTPAVEVFGRSIKLYGGGGPTFTMSRLCDGVGCTGSNDWGFLALVGVQLELYPKFGLFAEVHHKEDYMACWDPEGCFRGRRYGNSVLFGLAYRW